MAPKSRSKTFFLLLLFLVCASSALAIILYPDVSQLKDENPRKTSFMKYREDESKRLGKGHRIQQIWVPLSRISPYVVKAVLIAEDDKFWGHKGFDYEAIQKAIEKDISERKFKRGGSTITQQLAKNLYLSPAKNPLRKIIEALLTWRLESTLTKKRILELYLNVAEWGDEGIFGIEMAARRYYGKPASDIGPMEAARLAAVLPNPRKYSPVGDSRYVTRRAETIYRIMTKRGIVLPEYTEEALPSAGDREGPSEIHTEAGGENDTAAGISEQISEDQDMQKETDSAPGKEVPYSPSSTTHAIP